MPVGDFSRASTGPGWASLSAAIIESMPIQNPSRRGKKEPPLGETGQEMLYLRFLSEKQVRVTVKLRDGESVSGWIEYFDETMIRLTREGRPNLFIYKQQIRTISERGRREASRARTADGNERSAG
jgi:host factor-I protein